MMFTGPTKYYQVASGILAALTLGVTTSLDRRSIVPGAIAWDECSCGLLAVSIGQVYVSEEFPGPAEGVIGTACDAPLEVVEIIVQVVRCAPLPVNGAQSPTVKAQDNASLIMARDMQEVTASVTEWICENRDDTIMDGMVMPSVPQGPEGDCVGIEQHFLISLPRG